MLKSALALCALFTCIPAHASSFVCSGGILDYAFTVSGAIAGNRVVGNAHFRATKGGAPLHEGSSPIVSGSFTANRQLSFATRDRFLQMQLNASYQGGAYVGPMAIQSTQGNTTVTATCRVR